MAKLVSLTIDGRQVSVPQGTLIVNAAMGFALIDLDLQQGRVQVLQMSRMDSTFTEVP